MLALHTRVALQKASACAIVQSRGQLLPLPTDRAWSRLSLLSCMCMHAGELLACTGVALHAHSHINDLYFQLAVCLLVHSVCGSCRVDRFAAPYCDDARSCLCGGLVLLRHQHMESSCRCLSLSELTRKSLFELQISVNVFKRSDDTTNYARAPHLMRA